MNKNTNAAYVGCLLYIFVEYVRPQEKYDFLFGAPLGQIVAIIFLFFFIAEGRHLDTANRINPLILIFSLLMLVSALLGVNASNSFQHIRDVIKLFFFYFLTINTIQNRNQLYGYVLLILALYFLHTNFAFRDWVASGFQAGFRGIWVGSGYLSNPNDFGAALCAFWGVSLFLAFGDTRQLIGRLTWQWVHAANTLLFFIAILTSSSRGAALGFGISALFALKYTKFRFTWILIVTILAATYTLLITPEQLDRYLLIGTMSDTTAQSRLDSWRTALRIFQDYPLFGIGVGNFLIVASAYSTAEQLFVQHNIYLQALTELGIPGLLMLIMILIAFFRNQGEVRALLRLATRDDSYLLNLSRGLDVSMLGFMVAGFFITVLFYPFLWVNLTISALLLKITKSEVLGSHKKYRKQKIAEHH